jgi:uncharacterized integral membrane protein (TIGR00697 family)
MKKLKILKSSPDSITYQSESGTTLTAAPNEMLQKNILLLFDGKDRARIRELASSYLSPKMEYDLFWLGSLFALYLAFLLLAIPMSPNMVKVLNTFQPAGILIFPLTFIILDSVNEIFQYRYARMLTFIAATIMVIASALVYLTTHLFDLSDAYQQVFVKLPKLYLINALCLLVADQTNNIVFRTIRYRLALAPLWLRCIVSTTIGQISYTVIWICLFFGTSANADLIMKILNNYGFKVIYAACLIPVTYTIVAIYRSRKQQPQQEVTS